MFFMALKNRTYLVLLFISFTVFPVRSQGEMLRIDAHIHLYDTNREGSYTFLRGKEKIKPELFEPHLQETFLKAARPSGFSYTYVVEASARREDNFWLAKIADTSAHVLGFTANLNPLDSTFIADLDALIQNPKFRGVRPRIKGLNMSDSMVISSLRELDKRHLVLEVNSLKDVLPIATTYPEMTIVVNHFGSIRLKNGKIPKVIDYIYLLDTVAAHKNVYMKISALHVISGMNPAPTEMEYYKPLLDAALSAFSAERLIFGSNWPLSGLRGSYNNAVNILEEYSDKYPGLTTNKLFYENAIKAYRLDVSNVVEK